VFASTTNNTHSVFAIPSKAMRNVLELTGWQPVDGHYAMRAITRVRQVDVFGGFVPRAITFIRHGLIRKHFGSYRA
jgi:hypothetical protein